jgi:hypothetical protein
MMTGLTGSGSDVFYTASNWVCGHTLEKGDDHTEEHGEHRDQAQDDRLKSLSEFDRNDMRGSFHLLIHAQMVDI